MPDVVGGSLPPPSGRPQPGPGKPLDRPRLRSGPPSGRLLVLVALALLVTGVVLARAVTTRDDRNDPTDAASIVTTVPAGTAAATTRVPGTILTPTSTTPATTAPATTVPATTVPATTVPATTVPATTGATTIAATLLPEPGTTEPPPPPSEPATTDADGRAVVITSTIGPCRFGSRCLIAGFHLEGFRTTPATFTCIFSGGSRRSFALGLQQVRQACSTARSPDTITIEVDGVRSETVSLS